MKRIVRTMSASVTAWLVLASGCGADSWDMGAAGVGGGGGWGDAGGVEEDSASYPGSDTAAGWDVPEPEEEMDFSLQAPAASEHYVYIPAESRDAVIRVDAETLEIRMIPVGGMPFRGVALPVGDVAVIINRGTQDLSVIRSTPGDDDVETLPSLPAVNALSVSPEGTSVVVWYDAARAAAGDPVGDFQTIQVLLFGEGKATKIRHVSVGFHPVAVHFRDDGQEAYVVTDDGISVVPLHGLAEGTIAHTVPVALDPLEKPEDREVFITGDGSFAVVRDIFSPDLRILDMEEEVVSLVSLPGLPTDLDLVPGFRRCLVIMREQDVAAVVDFSRVAAGEEDAVVQVDLTGSWAGAAAVSPAGDRAVLYSTTAAMKSVAVMDLQDPEYPWVSWPVQKVVKGVAISAAGQKAVLLHEATVPSSSGVAGVVEKAEGYTLLDLDTGYRKLVTTAHRWSLLLFVAHPDGGDQQACILLPDPVGMTHGVDMVDLETFLVENIGLHSSPNSLLFVPSSRKVAINQEHPNGRITFIDVDEGTVETKTGFELNGLIN
ncbi:MAG: hypothetical protein FJ098_04300 [Deltaproteobacteria bacterium]|nr:hypothetical protein [Deltaproteobacteria bacterium]